MGIAGRNLTLILASRYISIEFQSYVILRLIWEIIVSQPSKCLKFMTFREGCFVIRN